ncbi:unnamed protein product [Arctogadus glacialis]
MDLLHARCRMERAFRDICIIALTETWLDDSVSDDEVSLDNFTIIRYRSLLCRRARYGKSLVPAAITTLNKRPR